MATTKKTETVAKETKAPKAEKAVKETKTTKAAPAKKETKTAEKKPAAKKTATAKAPAVKLFVEYQGVQVSQEDIVAAVMAAAGKAKSVEIYVKPEDGAAYYVADGESGKVEF